MADSRGVMNECINTIGRGDGRSSLQSADDTIANLRTTVEKPRDLALILELLHYKEERVAHDDKKFFLFREGTTSYVYLASVKALWSQAQGISTMLYARVRRFMFHVFVGVLFIQVSTYIHIGVSTTNSMYISECACSFSFTH